MAFMKMRSGHTGENIEQVRIQHNKSNGREKVETLTAGLKDKIEGDLDN